MIPWELFRIVKFGRNQLPVIKYSIGALTVVTIVAIIKSLQLDVIVAVGGSLGVVALMTVLLLIGKIPSERATKYQKQISLIVWSTTLCLVAYLILFSTSVFWNYPINFHRSPSEISSNTRDSNQVNGYLHSKIDTTAKQNDNSQINHIYHAKTVVTGGTNTIYN